MAQTKILRLLSVLSVSALCACGGGGGGDDTTSGTGGASGDVSGSQWVVDASITKDGCGERISSVHQIFTINGDTVDTSLRSVPAQSSGDTVTFEYQTASGTCNRTFHGELTGLSGSTGNVTLTKTATCDGQTCENSWSGTATRAQ